MRGGEVQDGAERGSRPSRGPARAAVGGAQVPLWTILLVMGVVAFFIEGVLLA